MNAKIITLCDDCGRVFVSDKIPNECICGSTNLPRYAMIDDKVMIDPWELICRDRIDSLLKHFTCHVSGFMLRFLDVFFALSGLDASTYVIITPESSLLSIAGRKYGDKSLSSMKRILKRALDDGTAESVTVSFDIKIDKTLIIENFCIEQQMR